MSRNTFAASRRSHRILRWLRAGEAVSIADVTERFDVEYPQARADLKLLEEIYDLWTERDGRTKRWRWHELGRDETDWALGAARRLADAVETLVPGRRLAEGVAAVIGGDFGRRDDAVRRSRVERIAESLRFAVPWRPLESGGVGERLAVVLDELGRTEPGWLVVRPTDENAEAYLVSPRRLLWNSGRFELVGWTVGGMEQFDLGMPATLERYLASEHGTAPVRAENRDVERALESVGTGDDSSTEVEGTPDVDDALDRSIGAVASGAQVEETRFEVTGRLAERFRGYRGHPTQETRSTEDGVVVEWRVACDRALVSRMQSMVPDVRILAPDHLRERVASRLEGWLRS